MKFLDSCSLSLFLFFLWSSYSYAKFVRSGILWVWRGIWEGTAYLPCWTYILTQSVMAVLCTSWLQIVLRRNSEQGKSCQSEKCSWLTCFLRYYFSVVRQMFPYLYFTDKKKKGVFPAMIDLISALDFLRLNFWRFLYSDISVSTTKQGIMLEIPLIQTIV